MIKWFCLFSMLNVLLFSQSSIAAGSARVLGGFMAGAIHVGAEYEARSTEVRGLGGYFFYQTEKASAGIQNLIAGGVNAPLHLIPKNRFDAYLAPGFGIGLVKGSGLQAMNETIIGPTLKLGAEYRFSTTNSMGLQYTTYYNWFSSKMATMATYSSVAASFAF